MLAFFIMKKYALILMICCSLPAFSEVLFTVGSSKITTQEFKNRMKQYQSSTVNPPSPQQLLEDWIRFEIGVQEAKRLHIDKDSKVQQRMRQVLYNGLLEKEIGDRANKIQVTENEMKAYYKTHPEIRSSHILIEYKENATAKQKLEAKKRAEEIWKEVRKSKRPFEDLVKLYSDDLATKNNGGDIGYQSKVTLVPAYYNALLAMKKGQVKGLIETRYGYHIVKMTGRRPYSQADKRQIRAAVYDAKRAELFNSYFGKLKKKYTVHVNKDALKAIKR